MNRHHRGLITIRIVVILLVGLAFLIVRFAYGALPLRLDGIAPPSSRPSPPQGPGHAPTPH